MNIYPKMLLVAAAVFLCAGAQAASFNLDFNKLKGAVDKVKALKEPS